MPPRQDAEPIATDAERAVVGSMLLDPAQIAPITQRLRGADFVDAETRAVFEAVAKRHRNGQPIDAVLLLRDVKPTLGDDAAVILAGIGEAAATAAHATHYADIVRDAALKRRIIAAASTAVEHASNGHVGAEVLHTLHAFADDELRSAEPRETIGKFTLGRLVEKYPRLNPPVVDGLVREGETMNVVAASKVGKSWFAYGLALSIITGNDWLGQFPTSPGKVLLIDNELHPETLASRIPAVAEAMGLGLDVVARDLDIWPLRGNLRSLSELSAEFDAVEPGEYKAVILDAKYRLVEPGATENDNAAETRVYNLLDQMAAKTRAALVVIHHASKGSQVEKAVTDVGAGAGAQSRATDCHCVLRPHEEDGCAVLDAAVRSFAPVDPMVLRWAFPVWSGDPSLDPADMKGLRCKSDEQRAESDRRDKLVVIKAMTDAGKPLTNRELRPITPFGKEKIGRLLDALQYDGQVISEEVTKRGNTCHEYRINPDAE